MEQVVRIRDGEERDAAALARFNRAMARETEAKDLDPHVAEAGVRGLLAHPDRGFYVVAELEGRIAASLMVTSEWSDWRNGLFWWVQSVYVDPACRRRGLLRRLYAHVRARAVASGEVCGLRLYVEATNRVAQRAYEALGMVPTRYRLWEDTFAPARPS